MQGDGGVLFNGVSSVQGCLVCATIMWGCDAGSFCYGG